jgi:hypothetical protein
MHDLFLYPMLGARSRRRAAARASTIALLAIALGASPAAPLAGASADPVAIAQATGAATARPITLRGTVIGLDGTQLRVATSSGSQVVRLVPPVMVTGATRAGLLDITPGTFLGTAARAQPDGSFRALEVHIFPESMRGTGEGHRPMEAPGTTMTNASVEAIVQRTDGPLLTLRHKDGETRVLVPPDAPIVRFGPGDPSLLVPGASIVVFRAIPADDGTLSASRLTVGVDGTRLPM